MKLTVSMLVPLIVEVDTEARVTTRAFIDWDAVPDVTDVTDEDGEHVHDEELIVLAQRIVADGICLTDDEEALLQPLEDYVRLSNRVADEAVPPTAEWVAARTRLVTVCQAKLRSGVLRRRDKL